MGDIYHYMIRSEGEKIFTKRTPHHSLEDSAKVDTQYKSRFYGILQWIFLSELEGCLIWECLNLSFRILWFWVSLTFPDSLIGNQGNLSFMEDLIEIKLLTQ